MNELRSLLRNKGRSGSENKVKKKSRTHHLPKRNNQKYYLKYTLLKVLTLEEEVKELKGAKMDDIEQYSRNICQMFSEIKEEERGNNLNLYLIGHQNIQCSLKYHTLIICEPIEQNRRGFK